jgi:hypothetical protein
VHLRDNGKTAILIYDAEKCLDAACSDILYYFSYGICESSFRCPSMVMNSMVIICQHSIITIFT